MSNPYHYVRLSRSSSVTSDVLIAGGEDHKTGQTDDAEARYVKLKEWAWARFPMMTDTVFRWSGQVMQPVDGPPLSDEIPWTNQTSLLRPTIQATA
jgi:hypothetical protein